MRIFRHDLTPVERAPGTVWEEKPGASMDLWVRCDRCRVAEAQVEVITDAGPVFFCQHHYMEHRDAILAAGHPTRAWRPGRFPQLSP
jgi:hypothetical protein